MMTMKTGSCLFVLLACPYAPTINAVDGGDVDEDTQSLPFGIHGHPLCPCLESIGDQVTERYREFVEVSGYLNSTTNDDGNHTYGVGCAPHDLHTLLCQQQPTTFEQEQRFIPSGDLFCQKSWCYVDTQNCRGLSRHSSALMAKTSYFSYATCGDLASYAQLTRFDAFQGSNLSVGFAINPDGWRGAQSTHGMDFIGPESAWSGVVVEYAREVARVGEFQIIPTAPPSQLWNATRAFWETDHPSSFEQCAYAVSLGYIDLCVGVYPLTFKLQQIIEWVLLDDIALYLVIKVDDPSPPFEVFWDNAMTVFEPLAFETWMCIIFGVIPFMAFTIYLLEVGVEGSDYPSGDGQKEQNGDSVEGDDDHQIQKNHLQQWKNINRALYRSLKAFLTRFYANPVRTYGGAWAVLGFCFFGMIGMGIYTAKMAAFLTTRALETQVTDLDEAISLGHRLCTVRDTVESIRLSYPKLWDSMVLDPEDGKPGFNCNSCDRTKRALDFLDPVKANHDPRYCHAAVLPSEAIEIYHGQGVHCNKTIAGQPVGYFTTAIPLSSTKAADLRSLFQAVKALGTYELLLSSARPESTCSTDYDNDASLSGARSLTALDLLGLWLTTIMLAAIGMVVSLLERRQLKREQTKSTLSGASSRGETGEEKPKSIHSAQPNVLLSDSEDEAKRTAADLGSITDPKVRFRRFPSLEDFDARSRDALANPENEEADYNGEEEDDGGAGEKESGGVFSSKVLYQGQLPIQEDTNSPDGQPPT